VLVCDFKVQYLRFDSPYINFGRSV